MKRILAACVLLLVGSWASAQVNGQGGVYINGVLQGGSSYSYLWSGGISMLAPTTDVAPDPLLLRGANAWPGATSNTTGANTILAGGIGRRIFTVVAYNNATVPLSTVTITINGTASIKTEGTDWFDTTGNNEMATSLAAAIDGITGVSATASSAVVRIVPDVGTYSLTIAKTAADAGMTATSGTDGQILFPDGTDWSKPAIAFASAPGVGFRLSGGHIYIDDGMGATSYATGGFELWTANSGLSVGSAFHIVFGPNSTHGSPDVGIKRGDVALLKITDGSTGSGNIEASTAITAVGTAAANGYIRTGVYKRAWTNAEVVALDPSGVLLTVNLKIATLPAKTVVRNSYLVIDSQAAGLDTLTVSLGRTATTYLDYIGAGSAMVSANTVYGDVSGERGANLTGYDMPSYTATTDVYAQFIGTDGGADTIHDVTACTGTVYLMTETLP